MNIEITRGDTKKIKFKRKLKDGTEITQDIDEMNFTVKKSYYSKEVLIQKKFSNGSITYNEETNYYNFTIESTDTDELAYGTYVFDIEVVYDNQIRTITKGNFIISEEVTFACNREEVSE